MKKMQVVICSAILLFNLLLNLTSCTRELKKSDQSPNSDQQKTENENKDKDKDKQETPVVVKSEAVAAVSEPQLELVTGKSPHDYKVRAAWPHKKHPVLVMVNEAVLFESKPDSPDFFEFKADEKQTYHVEFLETIEDSNYTFKLLNISIPEDIVISSNEVLEKNLSLEANRVFLLKNTLIETNEFNFSINAKELVSEEGAEIVNFQNKNQSEYKNSGLNGGNVSIISKNAEGKLKVNLNGTNGFKGLSIPTNLSAPQASNGKNGENGIIDFAAYDKDNKSCTLSIPLGRDKAVPGDTCTLKCICKTQPTNGENSHSGIKGIQGLPGSPGGDSGKLVVVIENKGSFLLEHSETPGTGGAGGEGSPGQLKGLVGKAGVTEKHDICAANTCQQAVDGVDTAVDGAPGSVGPQGVNGVVNPVCVKIGKGANACLNL